MCVQGGGGGGGGGGERYAHFPETLAFISETQTKKWLLFHTKSGWEGVGGGVLKGEKERNKKNKCSAVNSLKRFALTDHQVAIPVGRSSFCLN